MKALRGLSIRQRLLLASLLPAALIAALVSIYFVQDASKMLDRSVEERGLAIVGFLAPASEYGLIAGNRESLVTLLQAALNQRQVHAAAVIDRDGRALAMSGAALPPELARLRELPGDIFRFDQERYTVVGQRTDRRFRLGDELRVVVKAVDMDRRTVEFGLEGETMKTSSGKFERRAPKGAPAKKGFRQAPKAGKKGKRKGGKR